MNLIQLKHVNSTNTYAKENIDKLPDRTIVSADVQTGGYGRFERKWVDLGTENIYTTFVLKPSDKFEPVYANLTQYLSTCLCRQIEDLGKVPQIKWPNDVLLNGKKVCGILAESVIKGGILKGIVLGVGVNLNASVQKLTKIDRPATSLNLEVEKEIIKMEFLENMIQTFFKDYDKFLKSGYAFIKEDYEKFSSLKRGQNLKVAVFNNVKEGFFCGFDNNGNLLLSEDNGNIVNINMGEII